jgi:hypothetical protein
MSRSGYTDDYDDPLALGRWRSAVRSALNGRRGQAFLREMLAALDALPEKRLAREDLEVPVTGMPFRLQGGEVCALGAAGRARGISMDNLDPYESEQIAGAFGIADAMAREIVEVNDSYSRETPEARFARVREWVAATIRTDDGSKLEGGMDKPDIARTASD